MLKPSFHARTRVLVPGLVPECSGACLIRVVVDAEICHDGPLGAEIKSLEMVMPGFLVCTDVQRDSQSVLDDYNR